MTNENDKILDDRPKDYADFEEWYDDAVQEAYNESSFFVKVLYQLQEFIVLTILSSFLLGYLAGAYFGKFW